MKEKKVEFSILWKLSLLALLPAVILTIIILAVSVRSMDRGMKDEALEGLENVAYMFRGACNAHEGNYSLKNGRVMKGDADISAQTEELKEVIGADGVDYTLIYKKTRMVTTLDQSLVGKDISDEAYDAVSSGDAYLNEDTVIGGEPYFVAYIPLANPDGTVIGSIFAGKKASNVLSYIRQKRNAILGIAFILLIVIAAVAAFIARRMASAIRECGGIIQEVSEGHLHAEVGKRLLDDRSEIGMMAGATQELSARLAEVIGHIRDSAGKLTEAGNSLESAASGSGRTADGISSAVEGISAGAMSQAEDVETANSKMEEMGRYFCDIVDGVGQLDAVSDMMQEAGMESSQAMEQLVESNDRTAEAISKIAEQVDRTNLSASEIRDAVKIISEIASETNLLSLNASIEAARAGEAGRGFAVVASQIQKLADESSTSAKKIDKVVSNLMEESGLTVEVMNRAEQTVKEQQRRMDETRENFLRITEGIRKTKAEAENIRSRTEVCGKAREKMSDIIQNLSAISEENAASAQETTASMEELNSTISLLVQSAKDLKGMADSLNEDMEFFED